MSKIKGAKYGIDTLKHPDGSGRVVVTTQLKAMPDGSYSVVATPINRKSRNTTTSKPKLWYGTRNGFVGLRS